jgi:hypothetical protein
VTRRACAGVPEGISGVCQPPGIRQSAWSKRRIGDLNPGGCCHPTALAVPLHPCRSGGLIAAKARNRRPPVPETSAIYRVMPGFRRASVRASCVRGACGRLIGMPSQSDFPVIETGPAWR